MDETAFTSNAIFAMVVASAGFSKSPSQTKLNGDGIVPRTTDIDTVLETSARLFGLWWHGLAELNFLRALNRELTAP